MSKNNKLTSVSVDIDEFKKFKINSVITGISLKRLVNRTMFLFNTDTEYVEKYFTIPSGSTGEIVW